MSHDALKLARLYVMGEALPTKAEVLAAIDAALAAQPEPVGYLWRLVGDVEQARLVAPDEEPDYLWRYAHGTALLRASANDRAQQVMPLYTAPPAQPVALDVDRMTRECVPGGSVCDPQQVADALREWCAKHASQSHAEPDAAEISSSDAGLQSQPAAQPVAAQGWRWVPEEPTDEMVEAARNVKRQRLLKAVEQAKAGKHPDTIGMTLAVAEEWAAMLAAAPGAATAESKPLDDPRLQERFWAAISGAIAFGAQGRNKPPAGHWLTPAWEMGRATATAHAAHLDALIAAPADAGRQALTDERVAELWRSTLGEPHQARRSALAFARAIERECNGLAMTTAAADVLAERRRQIEVEGWTPEHDDATHLPGELELAACCYCVADADDAPPAAWPWAWGWWKPRDRRSNMVRAAALLLAAIEQRDRAATSAHDITAQPQGGEGA